MIARIDQDDTLPLDQVVHGECLSMMRSFPDNSVDSIVCDPPCGISFMNKEFDSNRGGRDKWILWLSNIMKEALRVLRPGGHCLVWSLPRTSHWTGLALEQAGFEMRDCLYHTQAQDSAMAAFEASLSETQRDALARLIDSQEAPSSIMHIFGQGFPKSTNISAMIDKMAGVEREVIGPKIRLGDKKPYAHNQVNDAGWGKHGGREWRDPETAPSTDDAKKWVGWGNNLKPACENWWLCRKPLSEKTLAANVLKWHCGGLNIDRSRVNPGEPVPGGGKSWGASSGAHEGWKRPSHEKYTEHTQPHNSGRFPSNVLFSHSLFCADTVCDASCPVLALEQQSGVRKSGGGNKNPKVVSTFNASPGHGRFSNATIGGDTGTASRFFHCFTPDVPFLYCAKSSRSERNNGIPKRIDDALIEEYKEGLSVDNDTRHNLIASKWIIDARHPNGGYPSAESKPLQNTHPTVKSLSLMKYLVSMITPDNGIVLDMFAGSGSTGVAAIAEGYHFIGIEQSDTPDEPYCTIARARIAHALRGEP